jgi:hypothetical protein
MDSCVLHPIESKMPNLIFLVIIIVFGFLVSCNSQKRETNSYEERVTTSAITYKVDSCLSHVLTESEQSNDLELSDVSIVINDSTGTTKTISIAKVKNSHKYNVMCDSSNKDVSLSESVDETILSCNGTREVMSSTEASPPWMSFCFLALLVVLLIWIIRNRFL